MIASPKASLSRLADNRWLMLVACALFTTGMIYNWIFPLGALFYTRGIEGNDCGQMVWNLWHTNEAISNGRNPFFASELYYPVGIPLAHHTLAAGFFPLTFLVKHLSGGDPMYPLYTYRLIPLICFTLLLYFSFWFLRELGVTRLAALAAAIGYSFSHFYMAHIIHINHLAGFLIPLIGLLAVRAYRAPGTNLLLLAFVAGVSVYFTEFTLYIYLTITLLVLAMFPFSDLRRDLIVKVRAAGAGNLVGSIAIFVLLVGPFVFMLLSDQVMKPGAAQASIWSGNLAGFVIPDPARTPLYGQLFGSLNKRVSVGVGGFETFIGFSAIVFSVVALIKARTRQMLIAAAFAGLFLVLSLGVTLKVFGTETNFPMPYALLSRVPPFDASRTPVRFIVIGLFFIMIVAAFGMRWLQNNIARRWGRQWSYVTMALVSIWSIAEAYQPVAKQPAFVPPPQLSRVTAGPVFQLPSFGYDGYASLLQVFHHQPISTGYVARLSENEAAHASELSELAARSTTFCEEIKRLGYRNIIVLPNEFEPFAPSGVTQLELGKCPVPFLDLRAPGVISTRSNFIVREGREEPVRFPLLGIQERLSFGSSSADDYLWYGWSGRETLSHWTNADRAAVIFTIDDRLRNASLKLRIFGAPFIAPGKLNSQRILITLNDQKIAEWTSSNPEPAERVIEIPANRLQKNNTLIFQLPDAASPRSMQVSADDRLLGFNIQWIELD